MTADTLAVGAPIAERALPSIAYEHVQSPKTRTDSFGRPDSGGRSRWARSVPRSSATTWCAECCATAD